MRVTYCYKVFIFIIIGILLLIDNKNFAKADSYEADWYEPYEPYHNPISRTEMSEFIQKETKMLEAKFHSQIELIKAKCLSESDIIKLIKSNIGSCKIGSHTVAIWTFPFHQNSIKKNDDFPNLIMAKVKP